ncbi:MAG TPA: alpha-L-fucosidase [Pedobacter sp.]|jgi:alpha-L-fucosidase
MVKFTTSIFFILISHLLFAQRTSFFEDSSYSINASWRKKVKQIIVQDPGAPVFPSRHPDAQWFPKAGLGLFMHWGIHSVAGLDPSWDMVFNRPWLKKESVNDRTYKYKQDRTHYYALAKEFNPTAYQPEQWIMAAKKAGFAYAVLTTKHHDGYALWPSSYGNMNTKYFMGGKDLIKPFVDACRRNKVKVGFYFSPRDWYYPGFPNPYLDRAYLKKNPGDPFPPFDFNYEGNVKVPLYDKLENTRRFDDWYAYTLGQLTELLTRYGKIDVLWFDGIEWSGIEDTYFNQTIAYIRKLQPGIVINPRWDRLPNVEQNGLKGDFETIEANFIEDKIKPHEWWEYCAIFNRGSWGYTFGEAMHPTSWLVKNWVKCLSKSGNFLGNVGPRPDGQMSQNYYNRLAELQAWLKWHKESVENVKTPPIQGLSSLLTTYKKGQYYFHAFPDDNEVVKLNTSKRPKKITLLYRNTKLKYSIQNEKILIRIPASLRSGIDDVVRVTF